MGDAVICQGRAAGQVGDVLDVSRTHNAFIKDGHVDEQLVESDILLCIRSDQIMEL